MCHTDLPPGQSTPPAARREVTIPVPDGGQMPALLAGSAGPPVLIVTDLFGRSPFYEHLASLLAAAGFRALLPDIFFRQGPLAEATKEAAFERHDRLDQNSTLRDVTAATDWLCGETGAATVGTIGFCMGGTLVLDFASMRDKLVTVAYYGFPAKPTTANAPPRPIDLVDDLRGPVLAFWGDQDAAVDMDSVESYVAAAAKASGAVFSHRIVPGLSHGFLGAADLDDPADAGGATWVETVEFFREQLA